MTYTVKAYRQAISALNRMIAIGPSQGMKAKEWNELKTEREILRSELKALRSK